MEIAVWPTIGAMGYQEMADRIADLRDTANSRADDIAETIDPPDGAIEAFAFWVHLSDLATERAWTDLHRSRQADNPPKWPEVGVILDSSGESARQRARYAFEKYGLEDP